MVQLQWQGGQCDALGNIIGEVFPVEVPGNIQYDFAQHEKLGDLNYGTRVNRFLDTESWYWTYQTEFDVPRLEKNQRCVFVAEGVDYKCDVRVNEKLILTHEGMFTPIEVELTDFSHVKLSIVIYPHPKREGAPKNTRDEADQSCKPPYCYGWAWQPRLLTSGLWEPAYLDIRDDESELKCEPFFELNDSFDHAQVHFDIHSLLPCKITMKDAEQQVVYCGDCPDFSVEHPHLWWCNGEGEPYLYSWTVDNGRKQISGTIGFRSIQMVLSKGVVNEPDSFPKSRYGAPTQIVLNGRKVFAQGSNWVNPELFQGRITAELLESEVALAKNANMNILRIWGGSGFCKSVFYDICDKLGIMVWQEFPLACNNYIGTPHYLAVLEQEASFMIQKLRHHACLVMWGGGNELFNGWSRMTEQSLPLRLLNKLCYDLDRQRPFFMTSPLTGMAHGGYLFYNLEKQGGECIKRFQNAHYTAYTEFSVPSLSSLEQIKKAIPDNQMDPITHRDLWKLHNAYGGWGVPFFLSDEVKKYYKLEPQSFEEHIRITQWMQCEGLKSIFEETRRQQPYCSMAINWCFNEPWVNVANNAILEYPDKPKPSYFAVKNALRPVMASARYPKFSWKAGENFNPEIWYFNNSSQVVSDSLDISVVIAGTEYQILSWNTGEVPPQTNRRGPVIAFTLPDVCADDFTLRIASKNNLGSEYCLRYLKNRKIIKQNLLNL